jgi:hypothetical protein
LREAAAASSLAIRRKAMEKRQRPFDFERFLIVRTIPFERKAR